MLRFVMFCKTYYADYDRLLNLVRSFHKYNEDNIILYISVPRSELHLYADVVSDTTQVISDESYAEKHFTTASHHGMSVGYANQQICKLSFFKTNITENYLCVDSDAVFIRKFHVSDFMFDEVTPFTVLVMDKDLSIERHYHLSNWVGRQVHIKRIYDFVGLNDRRLRTCHGFQVLNAEVLSSLECDFMKPKSLSYGDLLEISPYEFSWYNAWFQKSSLVREVAVEPFFKTLHYRHEYCFAKIRLLREVDFSRAYVGLVMNSKWYPRTPINYKDPNGILYRIAYNVIVGNDAVSKTYFRLSRLFLILRRAVRRLFEEK